MVTRRTFLKLSGAAGLALLNGGAILEPTLWDADTKEPVTDPLRIPRNIAQFGVVIASSSPFSELQRIDPDFVDNMCNRMVKQITDEAHKSGFTAPHSDGIWVEVGPGDGYDPMQVGYYIGYKQSFRREVTHGAEAGAAA